jgi:gluconate 5-dehydrogenase
MSATEIFDLRGRVVLITGASRGLGLAMAKTLGAAGARLVITARKEKELTDAAAELRADGLDVLPLAYDVSDLAAAQPFVARVLDTHQQIDVLINNAGATWGAPASQYPWEGWHKVMDVNVNGTWALTQQVAVQSMLPRRRGTIIIVASVAGLGGSPPSMPVVAYTTTKAAQINLARSLASEWGASGVRVNALLPGWFPTRMSRQILADHERTMLDSIPLGRFGEAQRDLAGPILFLASDASRYMTGQLLIIDGGQSAVIGG